MYRDMPRGGFSSPGGAQRQHTLQNVRTKGENQSS
jgi:hypothetical protein